MIWLIALILILQSAFYWFLKPAILVATPIFEMSGIGLILIALFIWLFSGSGMNEKVR